MLSCKEVVKILSSEESPSLRRRLELKLHLMMCHNCRKFSQQLVILKSGFKSHFISKTKNIDPAKIKELEDKVLDKIKK